MKVFVSWSGENSESHQLAKEISEWLSTALQNVTTFLSSKNLRVGGRWQGDLSDTLEACNFGIACLTEQSKSAPWIMFESGALAKKVAGSSLIALLWNIDNADLRSHPLSMFNNVKMARNSATLNKESAFSIIKEINAAMAAEGEKSLSDENLKVSFEKWWWKDLEDRLSLIKAPVVAPNPKAPTKKETELGPALDELLGLVRAMARRTEPAGHIIANPYALTPVFPPSPSPFNTNLLRPSPYEPLIAPNKLALDPSAQPNPIFPAKLVAPHIATPKGSDTKPTDGKPITTEPSG